MKVFVAATVREPSAFAFVFSFGDAISSVIERTDSTVFSVCGYHHSRGSHGVELRDTFTGMTNSRTP